MGWGNGPAVWRTGKVAVGILVLAVLSGCQPPPPVIDPQSYQGNYPRSYAPAAATPNSYTVAPTMPLPGAYSGSYAGSPTYTVTVNNAPLPPSAPPTPVAPASSTPPPTTYAAYPPVDQGTAQYQADLQQCQMIAQTQRPSTVEGAAGGGLLGAALGAGIGAIVGAPFGMAGYGASIGAGEGAIMGGVQGGASAYSDQKIIVANCMAGRGYRVLLP